jgi:hypothetical protein
MRHAWNRLVRKQWLIFYPLALAVINAIAFLAVYAASDRALRWSEFFAANFDRWQYARDHLLAGFAFTPALAAAIFAGLAVCGFTAMIRAPLFRAIVGPDYPLAPRRWREAGRLSLFYVFANLVLWVLPLVVPAGSVIEQLVAVLALVVAILIAFTDYVIVFEDSAFLPALRRSVRLLRRRWVTVVVIFTVMQLVYAALHRLYNLYYQGADGVSILLPLSQILVESFVTLLVDLVLIFLYEQVSRQRHA